MKKNLLILIASLAACSLTAYGYVTWSHAQSDKKVASCKVAPKSYASASEFVNSLYKPETVDLIYNVESRYMRTVTKEQVEQATTVMDLIPEKISQMLVRYEYVTVAVLHEGEETTLMGDDEYFSPGQISLLRSMDYSSNFFVRASCKRQGDDGDLIHYDLVYYMTVVPKNQASYTDGQDALIKYLRENSRKETFVITKDKLRPGRVHFSITEQGTISNVYLDSSSGFPSVDEKLIALVKDMPGTWEPATNGEGAKVNQELVFFFGIQGC
jgi:hypothetical protein